MENIETIRHKGLTWMNITNPTRAVLDKLKEKYKFHELDISDCLSERQRSKIDEYEQYLFIILHFPFYNRRTKRVETDEVKIFIGQDYVINVHRGLLKPLEDIYEEIKPPSKRAPYMAKGSGYLLYKIISHLFDTCFPILDDIEDDISDVEKDLFASETKQKDRLKDILELRKDIITFTRTILPQRSVVAQLEHKNKKFLPHNLEVYFDDVVDKIEKIWNNLENMKALVISLQEINESVISHESNNVMKTLTIFSVIMLPLTFITGLYGMNVINLPQAENPASFGFILLGMGAIAFAMLVFFKIKNWI